MSVRRWALNCLSALLVFSIVAPVACAQQPRLALEGKGRAPRRNQLAPRLRSVLTAVLRAETNGSYSGTRIVEQKAGNKRVLHTERFWKSGTNTRVEITDTGFKGQVIVENAEGRKHLFPKRNLVKNEARHRDGLLDRIQAGLKRNNMPLVSLAEGEAIAGYQTARVDFRDKAGNVTQQLWVEPRSGIVLKRLGYNRNGERVAYYEFQSVTAGGNFSASLFRTPEGAKQQDATADLPAHARAAGVPAYFLPASSGFQFAGSRTGSAQGKSILICAYHGPRGRLTVLVLNAVVRPAMLARRTPAGQSSYVRQDGSVSIVLIGPYSQDELQAAAAHIR